jgi:hypothetical protein
MNIANAIHSGNPISEVLSSSSGASSQDCLVEMASRLTLMAIDSAKQGKSLDSMERATWDMVLKMGRQALALFIQGQGNGDLGPTLADQNKSSLVRSEVPVTSTIRTVFGTHHFEQFAYNKGPKAKVQLHPISARMQLPDHQWSNLLQEFSQMLCVDQAYNQASENLSAFLGGKYSVDTLEATNQRMGIHAGQFMSDLPVPPKAEEGEILVATLDGKGIPMRKPSSKTKHNKKQSQDQPQQALPTKPAKERLKERKMRTRASQAAKRRAAFEEALLRPGNRRMATVASVYTVDPYQRTAQQIVAALFRDPKDARRDDQPARPRPNFKHTTAHLPNSYQDGEETMNTSSIFEAAVWCDGQLQERLRKGQKVVVLLDGQVALLQEMERLLGDSMIAILDIIHVSSYVWDVGKVLYTSRDDQLAFVRSRMLEILNGRSSSVVAGIRRMATMQKIKGAKRETIDRTCNYLESNAERMKYDEYLRLGYPIATGVIEGACRHLVKDRMERSGMRWNMEGARSMLNLRAAFQSDYWKECCKSYVKLNEPSSTTLKWLGNYQPATLAA